MRISEALQVLRKIQREKGDLHLVDEQGFEVEFEAVEQVPEVQVVQISAAD